MSIRNPIVFSCLTVLAILIAGLWPLRFYPENNVLQDQRDGLVFGHRGIAYTLKTDWRYSAEPGFALATWLNAEAPVTSHLANIVCITQDDSSSHFLIAQWRSQLILQGRFVDPSGAVRFRQFSVVDGLPAGQWRHVLVTSDFRGTRIFLDGILRKHDPSRLAIENAGGIIVLGNGAFGDEPWQGRMRGVAIYSRSMEDRDIARSAEGLKEPDPSALLFDFTGPQPAVSVKEPRTGTVYVPSDFIPARRAILRWDAKLDRKGIADIVLNFLGFLPFGFTVAWMIVPRNKPSVAVLWSSVLGFLLSAFIELTQAYLPGRSSSSTDLLFNSAGALVGGILFLIYRKRLFRVSTLTR